MCKENWIEDLIDIHKDKESWLCSMGSVGKDLSLSVLCGVLRVSNAGLK